MAPADRIEAPISAELARAFADSLLSSDPSPVPASSLESAPPPDVLTVDEVARWLGVNRKTVYAAATCGQLPCGRIGRRVLLSRAAIEAWLAGRRR